MALTTERIGYRGYIGSRPFMGENATQQLQNIVIVNYAECENLYYLLSATEYAMPDCMMMLEQVLEELPQLEGAICYSLFMLPRQAERRQRIYRSVIDSGAEMHFAVERTVLRQEADVPGIEALWLMRRTLPYCPKELPAWN
tara:strand:- start:133 stop:558 length:426 start_codon:yes stop_codon:yes gene_type:complete